jgi:hypothetical protein
MTPHAGSFAVAVKEILCERYAVTSVDGEDAIVTCGTAVATAVNDVELLELWPKKFVKVIMILYLLPTVKREYLASPVLTPV